MCSSKGLQEGTATFSHHCIVFALSLNSPPFGNCSSARGEALALQSIGCQVCFLPLLLLCCLGSDLSGAFGTGERLAIIVLLSARPVPHALSQIMCHNAEGTIDSCDISRSSRNKWKADAVVKYKE